MAGIIAALLIIICLLGLAAPFVYMFIVGQLREQKNFERGLKMVPLLIHLPPISDDTELGARDVRDVTDENISKAQVLYGIIASTLQKGFKHTIYGQRHFGFEIIAAQGVVHYYVAVPIALLDVVKQAILSAYPQARLEEVAEHNLFSQVGKLSGTIGGELTLKEPFAYPIATYQDLKRDAMQSLLNALSTLDKDDGVGIQILLRPAPPDWRTTAAAVAKRKRQGKDAKKGTKESLSWLTQVPGALAKVPEHKEGDKHEMSGSEQALVEGIEQKTQQPGYETLIRVIASSNISQKADSLVRNVVSTFALFESQGKNGFKYTPAEEIESFVTSFILRFFPVEKNQSVLNSVELATIFHFPDQRNIPTTQLTRQDSKQVDGPRNIPDKGLLLGYNIYRGVKKPIRLGLDDRRRHIYSVGQTGTGKSTLLENLALQDMLNGDGFAFIDPHGDTAEKLLSMVPKERAEDVVYFSPAEMDHPMGLNLFEFHMPEQKDFLIQEAIAMLYKLYDPQHQGIIGPRYESWFRYAALTVMADPAGGTFIDIPNVFQDPAYAKEKLKYVTDQTVLDFWNKEMASTTDYHKSEVLGWFVSKFGAFRANEMMRNIIGQTKSAFNLREIMDNKKILIVNLSKGRLGELNSQLLGMIFVMKFQAAAMSRATIPEDERKDFCLYVDEFQSFTTDSFATIMSEARKYRLNLIVANQFTTQLSEEVRDAVFGNIGTIVSFRVGTNDVESLVKYFSPYFDAEDLVRVPNANTIVRTLVAGVPTQPFSMGTLPPLGQPNKELGQALKQLSAAKYGRPKAAVEAEMFERWKTREPAKPQFGSRPPIPGVAASQPATAKAPKPAASFLDEWLAKRRQTPPTGSTAPKPATPPALATTGSTNPFTAIEGTNHKAPATATPHIETKTAHFLPTPEPPKPTVKTSTSHPSGGLNIAKPHEDTSTQEPGDTIFIDREGNIHTSEEPTT